MKTNIKNLSNFEISKFTKNQKILLFSTLAIISAIIAVYFTLSHNFGKYGTISKFEAAVLNKDTKTLASLLKASDKSLVLDDKNINMFITYLNKDHSNLNEVVLALNKQADAIDNNTDKSKASDSKYYITLKKSSKRFLLFDSYYLEIKPCFVTIFTSYKDTKIYLDDKFICTSDKDSFYSNNIPVITGTHKVQAIYETSLGKDKNVHSTDFVCSLDSSGKPLSISYGISLNAKYATIYTNFSNCNIYINKKLSPDINSHVSSTGRSLLTVGPIMENTKYKIYAEKALPWGTFKSREIEIDSSNAESNGVLNIDTVNADVVNKLKSALAKYNKETIIPALTTHNASLLQDSDTSSINYTKLKDEFEALTSRNINFTGTYLYSDLTASDISINSEDNNNYSASFEATDYYSQDYGTSLSDSVLKVSKEGTKSNYCAVYDSTSNSWTIKCIFLR